jgi:MFS family permease
MGAYVYVIASGAPFVAMDTIHLKAAQYGLLFLIPYGGQFMGAILAGRYSKKFSAYQVMYASYSCIILGTLIMLISFSLHWVNSFSLLASIFFIMLGMPPTYGSVTVMAMLGFKDKATGAAVMSFTTMIICLTAVIIYSLLPNHFPIVLAAVLTAFMLLAILLFWLGKRNYAENE